MKEMVNRVNRQLCKILAKMYDMTHDGNDEHVDVLRDKLFKFNIDMRF